MTPFDRAVYANAYQNMDAIQAGNAQFQAFPQDIQRPVKLCETQCARVGMGSTTDGLLQTARAAKAIKSETVKDDSGHFISEEAPEQALRLMRDFLQ